MTAAAQPAPDRPVDVDPARCGGLGIVLRGYRQGPQQVPYLVVDLGLAEDPRAGDALAGLFRRGLAPVRSFEMTYPAVYDWTYRYHDEARGERWRVSLLHHGQPVLTVPLRATTEWAALERRLGLAVVAVGNVDFADVSNSLHDAPGDHLLAQLDTRLAAGHVLGATVLGRQVNTPTQPTHEPSELRAMKRSNGGVSPAALKASHRRRAYRSSPSNELAIGGEVK